MYDLAVDLKIEHRFNKEKKIAGKDFFNGFKKRHPDLVLRTPQSYESGWFQQASKGSFFQYVNKID